jgi:hypothetical protein
MSEESRQDIVDEICQEMAGHVSHKVAPPVVGGRRMAPRKAMTMMAHPLCQWAAAKIARESAQIAIQSCQACNRSPRNRDKIALQQRQRTPR